MQGGARTDVPGLRRWSAVALLAILLVQAATAVMAAPGGDQQRLERRARTLLAKLQEQRDAMERLTEQIDEISARETGLEKQLHELQGRRDRVERDLAKAQRLLDDEVRNTYMLGPESLVGDLVTAPDLPEALNRLPLQRSTRCAATRPTWTRSRRRSRTPWRPSATPSGRSPTTATTSRRWPTSFRPPSAGSTRSSPGR